jgi:hypothetical protein
LTRRHALTPALELGFLLAANCPLPRQENGKASAGGPHESAVYKSTLQLDVRVYSFAGLSRWLLQTAEIQAARLLHKTHLDLYWVDCTSRMEPAACFLDPAPTDLVVRHKP